MRLPAKEVRSGDELADGRRVLAFQEQSGLVLLLTEDGSGPILALDCSVNVVCAETPTGAVDRA